MNFELKFFYKKSSFIPFKFKIGQSWAWRDLISCFKNWTSSQHSAIKLLQPSRFEDEHVWCHSAYASRLGWYGLILLLVLCAQTWKDSVFCPELCFWQNEKAPETAFRPSLKSYPERVKKVLLVSNSLTCGDQPHLVYIWGKCRRWQKKIQKQNVCIRAIASRDYNAPSVSSVF